MSDATRRDVLKAAAGLVAIAPAGGQSLAFFTPDEFRMVDELTEIIIPADGHSAGAKAAKVAAYLDARLAEAFLPESKQEWRDGLKVVERLSQELHGKRFLESSREEQVAVVTRMAKGESNPQGPEEKFFVELKQRTAFAYYTSKIGIHDELGYKGNTIQQEYSGFPV